MRSRIFPVLILLILAFASGCASAPLVTSTPGTSSPLPHTGPTATIPASPVPPTTNAGPAVVWKRTGGIAGMCQTLTIDFNGNYLLQDCKSNTPPATGELNSDQMTQLDDYLNHFEAFEWESAPPKNSADMFNDQLIFNGRGSATPSPDEQEIVNQFMASLAAELRTSATPSASAGSLGESGVQGQVTIGPACPGPLRDDNPCPDRPYQATITVLDQENKEVTQVQCDADGNFRIALPPGTYTLHATPDTGYPRSNDQTVTVEKGQFTQLNIVYDSGLR
jgi:hypothetical protein